MTTPAPERIDQHPLAYLLGLEGLALVRRTGVMTARAYPTSDFLAAALPPRVSTGGLS
jgi:hypothetical protein